MLTLGAFVVATAAELDSTLRLVGRPGSEYGDTPVLGVAVDGSREHLLIGEVRPCSERPTSQLHPAAWSRRPARSSAWASTSATTY